VRSSLTRIVQSSVASDFHNQVTFQSFARKYQNQSKENILNLLSATGREDPVHGQISFNKIVQPEVQSLLHNSLSYLFDGLGA
jgi:hypothetical protein